MTARKKRSRAFRIIRIRALTTKRVLAKHEKLLTLLAAMLVFTTFVVKDVWREESKDLVDHIDNSIELYEADLKNAAQVDAINGLVRNAGKTEVKAGDPAGDTKPQVVSCNTRTYEQLYRADRIREFVTKIPDKNDVKAVTDLDNRIGNLLLQCPAIDHPDEGAKDRSALEVHNDMWRAIGVRMEQSMFSTELGVLEINVELHAEAIAKESELRYERWRRISYWLYGLGWALTLVGKLSGLGGLKAGD